jgi:hypothetical protein
MAVGLFKNEKVSGASTTGTNIYTVPSGKYATVHAIHCANRYNLEDLYVSIEIIDVSTNNFYVAYLLPVSANMPTVIERPINLNDSEVLKITASRADSIDVVVSVLEFTP